MGAGHQKLHSQRGASVVFALVIFLMVTVFSFVMVTGALSNANNAAMQRKDQQTYLSVTSAAGLLRDSVELPLAGTESYITVYRVLDEDGNELKSWDEINENVPTDPLNMQAALQAFLVGEADSVFPITFAGEPLYQTSQPGNVFLDALSAMIAEDEMESDLRIGIPDGYDGKLQEVDVALKMSEADHSVSAVFSAAGAGNFTYTTTVHLACTTTNVLTSMRSIPIANGEGLVESYLIRTANITRYSWKVDRVERGGSV